MNAPEKDLVSHLTWDAVAARIEEGAAAVLPIGAGAKEHGLHLPMNTDELQAGWISGIIAGACDALIWPTVTYGYYPAFVNYAGSASLTEATFKAVTTDLTKAIAGFGAKPVLVVNTGISTIRPIDELMENELDGTPAVHIKVHSGPRYRDAVKTLSEQSGGTHADEMETSRMLALAPDLVQMDKAQTSPPGKGGAPAPLDPSDDQSPNYSPSGSWGDPTRATAEKGRILNQAMADDVTEMVRHAIDISQNGI